MNDFGIGACVGFSQVIIGHPLDTVKTLAQNNQNIRGLGLRGLFRGFRYPMLRSVVSNSVIFPSYLSGKDYTGSSAIGGLLSGAISTPLLFPFDVGKIRRQTGKGLVLKDFIKTPGLSSMFVRESIAGGLYFGVYDYLRNNSVSPFFAGGAAGLVNWTITYPIDVIKTRQISRSISIREAIKLGNFWAGYPICAVRAILVSGGSFWVYDKLKNL